MVLLTSEIVIASLGVALGVWLGRLVLAAVFTLVAGLTHDQR